jgi:hypothetical protein
LFFSFVCIFLIVQGAEDAKKFPEQQQTDTDETNTRMESVYAGESAPSLEHKEGGLDEAEHLD